MGFALLLVLAGVFPAPAAEPSTGGEESRLILTIEGKVEVWPTGANDWTAARTNQVLKIGDQIRTGFRSRATLQLSDLTVMRMNQLTTLEIQPPKTAEAKNTIDVKSGGTYFLGRDKPKQTDIRTPQTSGAILGTEFALEVTPDGRTVLTLIDGAVELTNAAGQFALASGEQATVRQGQRPEKTAVIDAINILQWSLYYPAVLDAGELNLGAGEQQALAGSLAAYRAGDLPGALAAYPADRKPATDAERVYLAGLVLAVGQVAEAESQLRQIDGGNERPTRLAAALRLMISTVKGVKESEAAAGEPPSSLATELLAKSYAAQSRFDLKESLSLARAASGKSPDFGFAEARVAELEFSFGRTAAAQTALDHALQHSPRNAQALALRGFLLAAKGRVAEAQAAFDGAIAADAALGNGWLGRGLVKIRQGRANDGRADLQVAATLEPQRALLRSYLGKAFSNARDLAHARRELELAKKLDPNDPTAWLYSALLAQQGNEINRGVSDLERSQELNDNRRLFRSRMLLDQDRAVRGANLAQIYRDAGMPDLSRREAARAVDADYANASAHLFLAESYDVLRDPNQVNLRYETPWLSELLIANLLAPVGAGPLSQNISQQEYSSLLERDRLGVSASTEYLSRGEWNHTSSQFGTFGNTAYAIDAEYHSSPGQRPNNDREQLTLTGKFQQQFTPDDSLLVQTIYYDAKAGDLAQYYDPARASRTMRLTEMQEPNIFAGWHHQWTPGSHTLALVGRLHDDFTLTDPNGSTLTFNRNAAGDITGTVPRGFGLDFGSRLEAFTGELQHLVETGGHTLIAGGRAQIGSLDNRAALELKPGTFPGPGVFPPHTDSITGDLNRFTLYAYDHWQILDSLRLSAGVAYDHLEFPLNSEIPPLGAGQETRDKVSPKAGLEWTPCADATVRGVYTRSLGGVFFDQSVRLEPTQLAGFNQAFRSLIPESVAGLVPGTEFETAGAALDLKFKTRTYVSFNAETLWSDGDRVVGGFDRLAGVLVAAPSGSAERLGFRERSVGVIVNQLLGEEWSLGASYRVSQAELNDRFVNIPATATASGGFSADRDLQGVLQQVNLYARFHHRCGFFGELGSIWTAQSDRGYAPDIPGDDFWQFNAFAGYRFLQRRAELRLGLLNIADQDYRLNPLNLTYELPRGRTLAASLKFTF
jgi:Tfp pilus assembly protein PilF